MGGGECSRTGQGNHKVSWPLYGILSLMLYIVIVFRRMFRSLALPTLLQYLPPSEESIRILRGHQLSVTCIAVTPDDKYIYSGSKDCCIIKCKFESYNNASGKSDNDLSDLNGGWSEGYEIIKIVL